MTEKEVYQFYNEIGFFNNTRSFIIGIISGVIASIIAQYLISIFF